MTTRSPSVVLAIAPGTRHLGYALTEGKEMIRYGVKVFPGKKTPKTMWEKTWPFLDKLLTCYRPRILAIEEIHYAQRRLCPLLGDLTSRLKRWGRQRGLVTKSVPPTMIKARLCPAKKTRRMLAEAMIQRHQFLARYLKAK